MCQHEVIATVHEVLLQPSVGEVRRHAAHFVRRRPGGYSPKLDEALLLVRA